MAIHSQAIHAQVRLLTNMGFGIKIGKKKMLQMPFLELYHVYIYYMTSHVQFG
jgi:hypothetical protein